MTEAGLATVVLVSENAEYTMLGDGGGMRKDASSIFFTPPTASTRQPSKDEMSVVSTEHILEPLNNAQRQAVTRVDGPLLILAGPGSGKTRVVTHRIAYLLAQGIPARSILALTFTNKAAEEMRNRLVRLAAGPAVWTGTFHRWCAQLLRRHADLIGLSENYSIYDRNDSQRLIKRAIENADIDASHYTPNSLAQHIGNLKSQGITADQFEPRPGDPLHNILQRVYPEYQAQLRTANAVDFDDLLLHCVDLLRSSPELRQSLDEFYQYVMVDEYQDTNSAQYQLIRLLNHNYRNLAVTGDPDQSIYGWRGANLNNILRFEQDYPQSVVVRLEQNYRSTKSILSVADQLITNNLRRKPKQLTTDNEQGEPVRLIAYPTPEAEAEDIADTISLAVQKGQRNPRDFAVFYRTNALSRQLEHALRRAAIPYQVVNGFEFYQRREVKDLLAYLHLINNPRDNVAFERVVNVPSRKIGKVTVGRLRQFAVEENLCLMEAARRSGLIQTMSKAAATKLARFVTLMDELSEWATESVEMIIRKVVQQTGYREWLLEDDSEEAHERAGNVDELIVAAADFDREHPEDGGLEAYLQQAALVSDTDAWDGEADYVSLMTMHAAKGLEFPHVFIVGCEDGILPHERSRESDDELEEERRLLFVGITRAQQHLQLSRCMSRFRRGSHWPAIASRFLMELPRGEMQISEPSAAEVYQFDHYQPAPSDDIPFEIDPWMHDGIQVNDDLDPRGREDEEHGPGQTDSTDNTPASDSPAGFPRLVTGAELAEQAATRIHPSRYRTGMQVEHPEYGVGTITALSGEKMKRTATIDFPRQGQRRIRLAFANLKIRSPESDSS